MPTKHLSDRSRARNAENFTEYVRGENDSLPLCVITPKWSSSLLSSPLNKSPCKEHRTKPLKYGVHTVPKFNIFNRCGALLY